MNSFDICRETSWELRPVQQLGSSGGDEPPVQGGVTVGASSEYEPSGCKKIEKD